MFLRATAMTEVKSQDLPGSVVHWSMQNRSCMQCYAKLLQMSQKLSLALDLTSCILLQHLWLTAMQARGSCMALN